MTVIMDILENAEYNLNIGSMRSIARDQLHNAIIMLNKGYDLYDTVDVDALSDQYGSLENVPEKEEL